MRLKVKDCRSYLKRNGGEWYSGFLFLFCSGNVFYYWWSYYFDDFVDGLFIENRMRLEANWRTFPVYIKGKFACWMVEFWEKQWRSLSLKMAMKKKLGLEGESVFIVYFLWSTGNRKLLKKDLGICWLENNALFWIFGQIILSRCGPVLLGILANRWYLEHIAVWR